MTILFLLFFSLLLPKHRLLLALITIREECDRLVLDPVPSDLYGWAWVKKNYALPTPGANRPKELYEDEILPWRNYSELKLTQNLKLS